MPFTKQRSNNSSGRKRTKQGRVFKGGLASVDTTSNNDPNALDKQCHADDGEQEQEQSIRNPKRKKGSLLLGDTVMVIQGRNFHQGRLVLNDEGIVQTWHNPEENQIWTHIAWESTGGKEWVPDNSISYILSDGDKAYINNDDSFNGRRRSLRSTTTTTSTQPAAVPSLPDNQLRRKRKREVGSGQQKSDNNSRSDDQSYVTPEDQEEYTEYDINRQRKNQNKDRSHNPKKEVRLISYGEQSNLAAFPRAMDIPIEHVEATNRSNSVFLNPQESLEQNEYKLDDRSTALFEDHRYSSNCIERNQQRNYSNQVVANRSSTVQHSSITRAAKEAAANALAESLVLQQPIPPPTTDSSRKDRTGAGGDKRKSVEPLRWRNAVAHCNNMDEASIPLSEQRNPSNGTSTNANASNSITGSMVEPSWSVLDIEQKRRTGRQVYKAEDHRKGGKEGGGKKLVLASAETLVGLSKPQLPTSSKETGDDRLTNEGLVKQPEGSTYLASTSQQTVHVKLNHDELHRQTDVNRVSVLRNSGHQVPLDKARRLALCKRELYQLSLDLAYSDDQFGLRRLTDPSLSDVISPIRDTDGTKVRFFISRKYRFSVASKQVEIDPCGWLGPKAFQIPQASGNLTYYYCGYSVFYRRRRQRGFSRKDTPPMYQFGCKVVDTNPDGTIVKGVYEMLYMSKAEFVAGFKQSIIVPLAEADLPAEYSVKI